MILFFRDIRNDIFFHVCIYICIYDKRQREIEIEKTNEQKKGVQEKKMKMRPSSGHGAQ